MTLDLWVGGKVLSLQHEIPGTTLPSGSELLGPLADFWCCLGRVESLWACFPHLLNESLDSVFPI